MFSVMSLFILGFFGGTHCVGMCGGLSSAFALHLPRHIPRIMLIFVMNLGRILSYVLVGILMGSLSGMSLILEETRWLQMVLYALANLLLLCMGLYLGGWWHGVAKIEKLGKGIWSNLNPLLNKLLPIKSFSGCLLVGMLWGWLPCGLVYNAALYALGSGSAMDGGLLMLAFGLGTLPNLFAMGVFATQLKQFLQKKVVRQIAGGLVCLWAVWTLIEWGIFVWFSLK